MARKSKPEVLTGRELVKVMQAETKAEIQKIYESNHPGVKKIVKPKA